MRYPNQVATAGKRSGIFFLLIFFGLGFLITGILNSRIAKERQTTESSAQGLSPIQESSCTNTGGECQTGKADQVGKPCSLTDGSPGTVYFNLCSSQPDDIRCCVPNGSPTDAPPDNTANYNANLNIKLQGIGPNSNPQNPTKSVTIKIFKAAGPFEKAEFVAQDTVSYDSATGSFTNSNFNLGSLPHGEYQMVIQMVKYLDRQLTDTAGRSAFNLAGGAKVQIATVEMRAGDIAPNLRSDNSVNIIDYNALIGCMPGSPPSACLNKDYADLNDDGRVDQMDLDILMLNFGENGFAFQTDQFSCEPDPACNSGKDALQLCSLLCTRKSQRS